MDDVFMHLCACIYALVCVYCMLSTHPQRVYSSRYIVPGDRQREQQALQFSVDAVVKDVLVGVVVWKGNTVNK